MDVNRIGCVMDGDLHYDVKVELGVIFFFFFPVLNSMELVYFAFSNVVNSIKLA